MSAADRRLRVGIIGYGRIGAEHARWITSTTNAQAVAVVDATAARRELATSCGLTAHESTDAILSDPFIDAVLIALPTAMHFDAASAALLAGKHVMVEKPVALTFDEARRLCDLSAARNRVLSVFHNRRWDVDYLTVKRAIDAGTFGRILNVESRLGQWESCVGPAAKEWLPQWRNHACHGGGVLYDWGSHFIDQIWQLMLPARPLRVFAQLRGNVWSSDCDDFARACIDFDNGAVAMVEINTTTTRPLPRWRIDGATGSAQSPHSPTYDTSVWAKLRHASPGGDERELPPAPPGLTSVDLWEYFAGACRGQCDPAVSMSGVLTTMRLLDAARQSSASGRTISFDG